MSKIPCPHCGQPIKPEAIICKHCGQRRFGSGDQFARTPTKITDTYIGWKLIGIVAAFLFAGISALCTFVTAFWEELTR